jgi:hypothetical protein
MKTIRESQLKRIIKKLINENFDNFNEEIPVQNRFEWEEFLIQTINSYRNLAKLIKDELVEIDLEINKSHDPILIRKKETKKQEFNFCLSHLRRTEEEYKKAIAEWENKKNF